MSKFKDALTALIRRYLPSNFAKQYYKMVEISGAIDGNRKYQLTDGRTATAIVGADFTVGDKALAVETIDGSTWLVRYHGVATADEEAEEVLAPVDLVPNGFPTLYSYESESATMHIHKLFDIASSTRYVSISCSSGSVGDDGTPIVNNTYNALRSINMAQCYIDPIYNRQHPQSGLRFFWAGHPQISQTSLNNYRADISYGNITITNIADVAKGYLSSASLPYKTSGSFSVASGSGVMYPPPMPSFSWAEVVTGTGKWYINTLMSSSMLVANYTMHNHTNGVRFPLLQVYYNHDVVYAHVTPDVDPPAIVPLSFDNAGCLFNVIARDEANPSGTVVTTYHGMTKMPPEGTSYGESTILSGTIYTPSGQWHGTTFVSMSTASGPGDSTTVPYVPVNLGNGLCPGPGVSGSSVLTGVGSPVTVLNPASYPVAPYTIAPPFYELVYSATPPYISVTSAWLKPYYSWSPGVVGTPTSVIPAGIVGYKLTERISATATAPFQVAPTPSGPWGQSTSLPPIGGQIFLRALMTTGGSFNGMVLLESGDVRELITLRAYAGSIAVVDTNVWLYYTIPIFTRFDYYIKSTSSTPMKLQSYGDVVATNLHPDPVTVTAVMNGETFTSTLATGQYLRIGFAGFYPRYYTITVRKA